MNQRYQQPSRSTRGDPGRQGQRGGRGSGYDDSRYGRDTEDMGDWEAGGRGERMYGASADDYSDEDYAQPTGRAYPQGTRAYEPPRGQQRTRNQGGAMFRGNPEIGRGASGESQPFAPRGQGPQSGNYRGTYGPEDFRQGSGQRQWQGQSAQPNQFGRQGQRQFAGQAPRGASNTDFGYGYGNYRQAQTQGYDDNYLRDYDEGDFGQSFGGYSPSQGGYGQSYSGYGSGGYGSAYGQGVGDDMLGTSNASYQSGAYGQGPGGYGGGFSQGLAGRGGYGAGSGYTRDDEFASSEQRGPHYGKGPKGYVRSDDRIREDLSEKLARHPYIDASDVNIESRNGAVSLTGSVADRNTKHYIEDMCADCQGVRDVDNRLTVAPRRDASGSHAGQSAATGTTGTRASTGSPSGTGTPSGTVGSGSLGGSTGEDGASKSRN